jgi:hypothetical protein
MKADGRCDCDCGTLCPLGRTGMELRCTAAELAEHIQKGQKMRELTIHKTNDCNKAITILADNETTIGGAPISYSICIDKFPGSRSLIIDIAELSFQNGNPEDGLNGITIEVLLAIAIDRLQCLQAGDFSCRENANAITKLEEAMHWLQHRTNDRLQRGVEGTSQK